MNIGDIKKEKKFAWFPTILENGKTAWMSYYTEEYVYEEYEKCYSLPFGLPHNRGKNGRFFFCNEVGWNLKYKTQ